MAAIANVLSLAAAFTDSELVNSSATVGSDRTFSPDGILPNGTARWVDRSGNVPAAYPQLTFTMRRPSQGNRNYKVMAAISIPTLETLGTSSQSGYLPGQKVGYSCVGRLEFVIPERATLAERDALLSGLAGLLCTSIVASDDDPADATGSPIISAVRSLEGVY